MDTDFFQKFLIQDDLTRLATMPEKDVSALKAIFESVPGAGQTNGHGLGDIRAKLHYHKAYTHIFIREMDMESGDFQCCLVDSSGCPELRGANFRELLKLGFKFDFDWDPETSFSAAMFYKIPEPEEKIEPPEWFSYPSSGYWRGMAALRDMLGKPSGIIYLDYAAGGLSHGWEEMKPDDDIPTYVPDDLMAWNSWFFALEIRQTANFTYELTVRPDGENLRLNIVGYAQGNGPEIDDPDSEMDDVTECRNIFTISRKEFTDSSALSRHLPEIIARIKDIMDKEI